MRYFLAIPHDDERIELDKVIPKATLNAHLERAATLLNIHPNEYDQSIRHNLVRKGLTEALAPHPGRTFTNIPLAVQRRVDNPDFVTWTGTDTVLGEWNDKFELLTETRVTQIGIISDTGNQIGYALLRDLNTNNDRLVMAKVGIFYVYAYVFI